MLITPATHDLQHFQAEDRSAIDLPHHQIMPNGLPSLCAKYPIAGDISVRFDKSCVSEGKGFETGVLRIDRSRL